MASKKTPKVRPEIERLEDRWVPNAGPFAPGAPPQNDRAAAFAQQGPIPGRPGTAEEQAACNRDVQRHCRKVIDQGDFVVLACLKENRTKISAACDQVLKTHGQ